MQQRRLVDITPDEIEHVLTLGGLDVPALRSPGARPRLWDWSSEQTGQLLRDCLGRETAEAQACGEYTSRVLRSWVDIVDGATGTPPPSLHPDFAVHPGGGVFAEEGVEVLAIYLQQSWTDTGEVTESGIYLLFKASNCFPTGLLNLEGLTWMGDTAAIETYLLERGITRKWRTAQ